MTESPGTDHPPLIEALRRWDPEQIGGFLLVGRLGAGAMGRVYLGRTGVLADVSGAGGDIGAGFGYCGDLSVRAFDPIEISPVKRASCARTKLASHLVHVMARVSFLR